MSEAFLKGNFKVKKEVTEADVAEKELSSSEKISKELREAALQVLGGSMVYVERTNLSWDGEAEKGK